MKIIQITLIWLLFISSLNNSSAKQPAITINGTLKGTSILKNSSLTINLYADYIPSALAEFKNSQNCLIDSLGKFSITLNPSAELVYISFSLQIPGQQPVNDLTSSFLVKPFLFSAGDVVNMDLNMKSAKIHFSGKGAAKLNCQALISSVSLPAGITDRVMQLHNQSAHIPAYQLLHESLENLLVLKAGILNSYKDSLAADQYQLIETDMAAEQRFKYLKSLSISYTVSTKVKKNAISTFFNDYLLKSTQLPITSDETLLKSAFALNLAYQMEWLTLNFKYEGQKITLQQIFDHIVTKYKSPIRDRLLLICLLTLAKKEPAEVFKYAAIALKTMDHSKEKDLLINWTTKHTAGSKVYNFTLLDENGKTVRLTDFKDSILLIDFWFLGCKGCTQMPKALEGIMERYKHKKDVKFISLNVDRSRSSWMKGLESGLYHSKGQINLNTGTMGTDHPLIRYYNYNSYPQLLIIGRNQELISSNPIDPRIDQGAEIKSLIDKAI
ncbi:thioredoxin-like domain-containing protein [Pedobacter sp. ASV1-7]|uniref:TlpA family protein disulfide reductase n=1 Tax=Pedobacter sp. ASV1-7 TaxID=3145237 RepID=UPI0032E8B852